MEDSKMKNAGDGDDPVVEMDEDIFMSLSDIFDESNSLDELMKFVDDSTKVKFIENPYSTTPFNVFQSSSSYVTINGNEETCGSSFSDWESSVMASVDVGGFVNTGKGNECGFGFCEWFQGGGGGAWGFDDVETEAREGVCGGFSEWDFLDYECFVDGGGGIF
ncbi:uncharacterized protein LOC126669731 [Mercurialis annua]|uniref:uncharacterized protein LOC126669731 n=1 Tax=Mercurialis annua TaxID=3986 RepID=UPI002160F5A4|nr:uncharacterized protein LOC126669731 [Mercurialis annua]